jgi:hypothetical protein
MTEHRRAIGRALTLVVFAALALAPLAASAQTEAQKKEAKEHYEKATRFYEVEKYAEAIDEYQRVYLLVDDPNMLYNIAQAYRLWGKPDEAIRSYRNFLRRSPNAPNRADVEKKIGDLEKTIEERRRATTPTPPPVTAPPTTTEAPPPQPPPANVAPPAIAPPPTSVQPPTTVVVQPMEPVDEHRGRRVVAYSLVIGGSAFLVAAGVAGALANSKVGAAGGPLPPAGADRGRWRGPRDVLMNEEGTPMRSGLGPLLVACLFWATCYNPQISSGGLKCGPNKECPSGLTCKGGPDGDSYCYKAADVPMGTGGMGGGGGVCTTPTGMYGPFANCEASVASGCDSVCQTGCACDQRCKLENGEQTCRGEGPNFTQLNQDCDPRNDTCRPGSICLQESSLRPACGAHCYRQCTKDEQCENSRCTGEITFGMNPTKFRVCSPPTENCNPWASVGMPARCMNPNRPSPPFGCYIQSGDFPDAAICDCAGTTKINEACQFEHECEPGAECVLFNGQRQCRKVCKLGAVAQINGACPGVMVCSPFMKSIVFGFCHL